MLSDIEIPQLLPGVEPSAVRIRLGKTPTEITEPVIQTSWHQLNNSQCLFSVDGIAKFFVEEGETIVVEPNPNAHPQTINLWLLGAAIPALLHQRQILPLHASAVEVLGGAILIVGASGTGKSTTAAGFLQRGCRLISDDVSALMLNANGEAMVAPAYPQQKLWQDALDHLDISSENLDRLDYYRTKYVLPRHESFCDVSVPVRAVYILAGYADNVLIRPVSGMSKLTALSSYIYRLSFMPRHSHSAPEQTTLMTLAAQVAVSEVWRREGKAGIDALVGCILDELRR